MTNAVHPKSLVLTPIKVTTLHQSLASLPTQAPIRSTDTGFIYVDIDDDYIHRTFSLLNDSRVQKPEYFNQESNYIGAHISIIYPEEAVTISSALPEMLDDIKISGVFYTILANKGYYALKVSSAKLNYIRVSNGLPCKLTIKGHSVDPHITVAVVPVG